MGELIVYQSLRRPLNNIKEVQMLVNTHVIIMQVGLSNFSGGYVLM